MYLLFDSTKLLENQIKLKKGQEYLLCIFKAHTFVYNKIINFFICLGCIFTQLNVTHVTRMKKKGLTDEMIFKIIELFKCLI